jgi:hypothetical protein
LLSIFSRKGQQEWNFGVHLKGHNTIDKNNYSKTRKKQQMQENREAPKLHTQSYTKDILCYIMCIQINIK